MSYLLTEIALDMLGYKFYDVNGIYHTTNFQSITDNYPNDDQEPPLEEIIYPNGLQPTTDSYSTDSDECIEIPNIPISKISINQNEMVKLNIKESIDKEIDNLRGEIYDNKTKFLEDNIKLLKKKDKGAKITPSNILQPYNEREKKNIRNEAAIMSEFLKNVEKHLEEADPKNFQEHKLFPMDEFV